MGKKNWGCFGAQEAGYGLRGENEYFSFKKNIPKIILGWIRKVMMAREGNEALG